VPHQLKLPILLLASQLDHRLWEIEAANFPEVSRLASRPAVEPLRESLRRRLQRWPAVQWASRVLPDSSFERVQIPVTVPPARQQKYWTQPFLLKIWGYQYEVPGLGWVLCLPHLPGLDVVAEHREELFPKAQAQILSLLKRDLTNFTLEKMVELSRCNLLRLGHTKLHFKRPTLHQLEQPNQARTKSLLDEVGQKLNPDKLRPSIGRNSEINEVLDHLTANEPLSVALIGPAGCGKTAVFFEALRRFRSLPTSRGGSPRTFYQVTASSLMAGQSGFGAWQQRCQDVIKAANEQHAIVHLGGIYELVQVGRHSTSPNGMAGVFRQREFISVVEATPQQWSQLLESHPHLLSNWQAVRLDAPNPEQVRQILQAHFPKQPRALIDETAYLHQRWCAIGAPRRPIRFLAALETQIQEASPRPNLKPAQQAARAFSKETGLPTLFLEEGEPFQTKKIQAWFEARVLGQSAAVQQVIERLRTVKTALSRPGRPIANFLLMGPTGVGKTELARTLAEFVFQDRTRLTRFDMSEYSHPLAVSRLIGVPGHEQPGLLTSRVQEYPFQVVLFDELEKAHSDFFDLLLQILGDARLTDCHGEVADFSNCIILMTSNLGAVEASKQALGIRGSSTTGDSKGASSKDKLYRDAAQSLFRPELINRLDGLIPFAPLSQEIVLNLATKLLDQLPERSTFQGRAIHFEIGVDCAQLLSQQGFDVRYGARPLKRALDRLLLAPLAVELNRFRPELPLEIVIGVAQSQLKFQVRSTSGLDEALAAARRKSDQEDKISQLRRLVAKIDQGPLTSTLQNQIISSPPQTRKRKLIVYRGDQLRRSGIAEKLLTAWRQLLADMEELEDLALLSELQGADPHFQQLLGELATTLRNQLIQLWAAQENSMALFDASSDQEQTQSGDPPPKFLLAIYGTRPSQLSWLAKQYLAVIDAKPGDWRLQQILVTKGLHPDATDAMPRPELTRYVFDGPKALEVLENYKGIGLVLELKRNKALLALQTEAGIHSVVDNEVSYRVQVELSDKPLVSLNPDQPYNLCAYQPPPNIHRQGTIPKQQARRTYTLLEGASALVEDLSLDWLMDERHSKQSPNQHTSAEVGGAFRLLSQLSGLDEMYRQRTELRTFIQARQLLASLEAGLD
jgi:ATP-dependent Clp protease ATP-binding subunit ClpC